MNASYVLPIDVFMLTNNQKDIGDQQQKKDILRTTKCLGCDLYSIP